MAIAITRKDYTAEGLRRQAGRCQDADAARRILAVALVLDGSSRGEAAKLCGMERQTLRDWVHRYEAEGLDGLFDRPRSGRPPGLTAEQEAELARMVEAGPELETHGVIRWRRVDLQKVIAEKFAVSLHERSVGRLLRKLGFRRVSPRPRHPETDQAAQETFKKEFAAQVAEALLATANGKPIEVWFQDEARVGQQGTLAYVWAKRGTRPRAMRDRRFTWAYLFGAVCPDRGTGAAVIMPEVNVEAMNEHLAEISQCVSVGAIALLVLDGAGWHNSPRLVLPDNIALLPLPPYAPELNPVENIWQYLRQNQLSHRVWDTYQQIIDACRDAWNSLIADPSRIKSIATRDWAKAS